MNILPAPGSPEEIVAFERLQARLPELYRSVAHDERGEHTVIVVPSLSLDARELAKVSGVHHYEERLLYHLMLLRRPRTRVIFVTSSALSPTVVDYYLHLLSGIPYSHASRRLVLLNCADASSTPLSAKILGRPRLMNRIREAVADPARAHMVCFNSSNLERTLAVQLGAPLYANDPARNDLGTKSGSREVFREAGILFPDGFEHLRSADDIAESLAALKVRHPTMRRAVVKLNDGFSGEGNALFYYDDLDGHSVAGLKPLIRERLHRLRFEAPQEHWESFEEKYEQMGGIVEQFIEGEHKRSPSSQNRVNAVGQAQAISTHGRSFGAGLPRLHLSGGSRLPDGGPGGGHEGGGRPGATRRDGPLRHGLRQRPASGGGLHALRDRGQPPKGRDHPPLPHASLFDRRLVRPRLGRVLGAERDAKVLLRLRYAPE
jgi:hypothetical protein